MTKEIDIKKIKKGDVVYYARIMPKLGIFDVYDLKIRTVKDTYFVGVDKRDKRSYLFSYSSIDDIIFLNRKDAVNKTISAEENAPKTDMEMYYEEY